MYPNQSYGQQPPFGAGYPPQQPGYPPQQPGYPPQQPGYPPQQPGYPPQQPGYPPQQPGYPPQQPGYPPQQPFGAGFQQQMPMPAPMTQPSFPPQQPGYPPQQPPQPAYPQEPMVQHQFSNSYQQAAPPQSYGQAPPQQPFGQAPPPQSYGQAPPQQPYGQAPPPQSYGQAPPQQPYGGQAPYQQPYSQMPQQMITKGRPTVIPAQNFNASNDCVALRKAMKGFGTDEDAIIEVLCRRTINQRLEIIRTFKTAYGKDLQDEIRSETSGNFQKLLLSLLTQTFEFYASELHESINGAGTDEDVLLEVMCGGLTNYEIRTICGTFQRIYGRSLESDLKADTSGSFKRLMTSLSCGSRDESMVVDVNQAKIDAQSLKSAGIGRMGTDESEFNRVLCTRNYEQIKLIAREYEKLTGHLLEKDIKKEFSGDIEDGLLSILRVAENKAEFFARRLHKSMAGLGTNDRSLIRLVVSRCEIDMMDIKEAFARKYGKTLKSFIKGDTSGHYRHALYALIGENRS